ncbi:EspA/EspE family type VII secretion system effector [Mycolicibacterium sp.]|uniref:EspA/EspE family type VII secretion system effector n=1 Tax=Mycolicibacterium sp. TaxID=2320850 RepID=UPI0037C93B13|nr:hypothetical protein [Mycobacterium sp. DSM 3803]
MSAIDAFYSTWSQARESFGSGVPQDGSEFDKSNQLRQLQSSVQGAAPDSRWQGPAADAYAAKNAQQAATYGKLADLDQRMAAEVSKTAGVVTAGRQNLDQIRDWVASAAASAPSDRSGETMKVAIASKGLSQISEIIQQSNDQMNAIGERIRGIGREYDEIGEDGDKKKPEPKIFTASGNGGAAGPDLGPMPSDADDPWGYPWEPPPPPDSREGGGRWEIDYSHPYQSPDGKPPTGTPPPGQPWHKDFPSPITGLPSGFQPVVKPPPNGWGAQPGWSVNEAYRFRVVGEGYDAGPNHTRWVHRDGSWYPANWVGYDFEAEHQVVVKPNNDGAGLPFGQDGAGRWNPINIDDIYKIQVDNPQLPLYIPNPFGGHVYLDPNTAGATSNP